MIDSYRQRYKFAYIKVAQVLEKSKHPIIVVGCGYLGLKLVQQLLARNLADGQTIHTFVKTPGSQKQCLEAGVQSSVLDLDHSNETLPEAVPIRQSLLYYFVPPPGQGTQDSRAGNFLKMLACNALEHPAKAVLISTTGVYGNCHGQWVDEETPLNPGVDRARRRVDAEHQFQSYCQQYDTPLVILRVSGIYGPGKLPLKRIRAQTPIVREEDSPFSNRIHAEDLLEICLRAGFDNKITGIFNCADGNPTTMYDYFMRVARARHLPEPPAISLQQAKTQLSAGMLSYMEESRRINIQKLLRVFDLSLKYPDLEKGLKQD